MPAIDLSRLAREVERLETLFGSPPELRRATLDVLSFYGQRARRAPDSAEGLNGEPALGVPPPVVRAIGAGLQGLARRNPAAALPAAAALWDTSEREARMIACWVLSALPHEQVAAWLEARAGELDDAGVLKAAVERALEGWRRADGKAYVVRLDRWIASPHNAVQALGLRALEAGLDLPEMEDLQFAFQALTRLPRPARGEARSALESVLARLADRSPAEMTRFLLEDIQRQVPGIEKLVRLLAGRLPPAQRERLMAALAIAARK
ncbi:MAG: hypothetical protein FJZ97_07460 [Chloroflexi bacterium]|nr:hypothetical protein [Chloroflexota bacterium]